MNAYFMSVAVLVADYAIDTFNWDLVDFINALEDENNQ